MLTNPLSAYGSDASNIYYETWAWGKHVKAEVSVDGRDTIRVVVDNVHVGSINSVELADKQEETPNYTLTDAVTDFLWNTNVFHDV
ncbi:MAG: hypothetical protein OXI43_10125 [Candidatus Poribacteria bacterium]|nr:hypothetical protein [Candidatus Poribacteria bacterium]